jgi:hypothetical protein
MGRKVAKAPRPHALRDKIGEGMTAKYTVAGPYVDRLTGKVIGSFIQAGLTKEEAEKIILEQPRANMRKEIQDVTE